MQLNLKKMKIERRKAINDSQKNLRLNTCLQYFEFKKQNRTRLLQNIFSPRSYRMLSPSFKKEIITGINNRTRNNLFSRNEETI